MAPPPHEGRRAVFEGSSEPAIENALPGGATFSIVCPRRPTGLLKTEASNNAKDGTSAARGTYPRGPPFPLSPVPTGPLLLCVFALNSEGDRVSGWRMKTMMFTSAGKSASVCAICGFSVWVAIWVICGHSLRVCAFATLRSLGMGAMDLRYLRHLRAVFAPLCLGDFAMNSLPRVSGRRGGT